MSGLSKQQQNEWRDPTWRLNNLYQIQDKEGNTVPFKLNAAQSNLVGNLHYLNIILKARQMGFSTVIQLYMLDQCLFNSGTTGGIIADTIDNAKKFLTRILFAYDRLPELLRKNVYTTKRNETEVHFSNGASIIVGTSHRSGTLQILHVSEYGKICSKYPEKANEIKSGALNTIAAGQMAFIESTAEGRIGHFYKMVTEARNRKRQGLMPTKMDWVFHFYPWFLDPTYTLDDQNVIFTKEHLEYFAELEAKANYPLKDYQKRWYVKKLAEQGEDMKKEFPSTPEEAFEVAIQGAYFHRQMLHIRQNKQIQELPLIKSIPVNTFWDIGVGDTTNIWFHQEVGPWHHFLNYYLNHNEGLIHYWRYLNNWAEENEVMFGEHYWPHDGVVTEWGSGQTRIETANKLGFNPVIVPRVKDKQDSIEAARQILPLCRFDSVHCDKGITHLDQYRKSFNELTGTWHTKPLHDESSNGADAFQTFATGYQAGNMPEVRSSDRYRSNAKRTPKSWMAA